MKSQGFTLVELVVVILVLAILAAYAVPKFFNLDLYRDRSVYDEVTAAVRYAQKLAVASGCQVQVQLTSSSYVLQQLSACSVGTYETLSDQHPVNSSVFSQALISPGGTFVFDPMGRCSADVSISVGRYSFSVVSESGYVDSE